MRGRGASSREDEEGITHAKTRRCEGLFKRNPQRSEFCGNRVNAETLNRDFLRALGVRAALCVLCVPAQRPVPSVFAQRSVPSVSPRSAYLINTTLRLA